MKKKSAAIDSGAKFTFQCPECGKKFSESVARLDNNEDIVCPGCGSAFKTDQISLSEEIERGADELAKALRNLSK